MVHSPHQHLAFELSADPDCQVLIKSKTAFKTFVLQFWLVTNRLSQFNGRSQ
jgi:hypothetical protein